MSASVPGRPNPDVLGASGPPLPFIYLDWNVVQYLRKNTRFAGLLKELQEARDQRAAVLPYTTAHCLDATAHWHRPEAQHEERTRDASFIEDLSGSLWWDIREASPEPGHVLGAKPFLETCEDQGYLLSFQQIAEEDPELAASAWEKARERAAEGSAELRQQVIDSGHVHEEVAEAMIAGLQDAVRDGLPNVSEAGSTFMKVVSPGMLASLEAMPAIDPVHPADAIDELERKHPSLLDVGGFLAMVLCVADAQGTHPDALGPTMLGALGYFPDRRKTIQRAAPGFLADILHAQHGLSAAVFITADKRLSRRVEAWALTTSRGNPWPLVVDVEPDDVGSVHHASQIVRAYTKLWAGRFSSTLDLSGQ